MCVCVEGHFSQPGQTLGKDLNAAVRNTNPVCYLPKSDYISCSDVLSAYLRTRMALESGKPRVIWTMTPRG